MAREQHDDHCLFVLPDDTVWKIAQAFFPTLLLRNADGRGCMSFRFNADFNFARYCDDGALHLLGRSLRAERGLPVSTGSEARN
jgi:hypothetical protein